MADRVTVRLSSMSSTRAVAVSFFPCHQWCGSADVRSAVLVDRRHGSAVLAPAVVSKVWSCAPAVAGGSWPGVSASLRVGIFGRVDGRRCLPELGTMVCIFFFVATACRGFASHGEWFCSSQVGVGGGGGADSREPMAVFVYRVLLAAFQGWMSAPRVGKVLFGVWKSRDHAWCTAELRRKHLPRKKIISRSRDLDVILLFSRVLSVRKACTVLLLSI